MVLRSGLLVFNVMVYRSLVVWTPTAAVELSVSATYTGGRMVINKDILTSVPALHLTFMVPGQRLL